MKDIIDNLFNGFGILKSIFTGEADPNLASSIVHEELERRRVEMAKILGPIAQMAATNFIGVAIRPLLCDSPAFLRWKRNHRRSRINKKWHKKYGGVYSKCPGKGINVFGFLYLCPHAAESIRKETPCDGSGSSSVGNTTNCQVNTFSGSEE